MTRSSSEIEERSVAVVGLAGRFPGASSPEQLWGLLCGGVDATSTTPGERYDADALFSPARRPGTIGATRGGYLNGVADFDVEFFDMSPTEAAELDPQQRLLLMSAWEALEDAGLIPDDLAGSRTGVFVGNAQSDYLDLQRRNGLEAVTPSLMNNYRALLPGRLSWFFDFRGPTVLVDTACSSSLVAVHQAVQSLRAGETPLAIAAGVNLKLVPDESVLMTQAGTLARDGRSKFGDATADGYGPSDGAGVVVLKRLRDAVADGDRIRAVIQGSAIGNDGHSSDSLLAPSVEGQTQVLRWAHEDAGVSPADVDFVEAHGSGSGRDDAVELTALGEVLGEGRSPDHPCFVGSVKTNLGHSQAAAGITGLIKTVLCLEHGQLPPSLHFAIPNPLVAWDDLPLAVPTRLHDLPDPGRPLIAGVTGQGLSALNAHLVVRQGQTKAPQQSRPGQQDGAPHVLALSARTPQALQDLARAYVAYLAPDGEGSAYALRDICFTAATRRQQHTHRLVVVGSSHAEVRAALQDPAMYAMPGLAEEYRDGNVVPLPAYPWQTKRYWLDARADADTAPDPAADPADAVLHQHARIGYTEGSRLSDIGIDSLALLRIVVQLGRDYGHDLDADEVADLHTVSAFRQWVGRLEAQTA